MKGILLACAANPRVSSCRAWRLAGSVGLFSAERAELTVGVNTGEAHIHKSGASARSVSLEHGAGCSKGAAAACSMITSQASPLRGFQGLGVRRDRRQMAPPRPGTDSCRG